MFSGLRCNLMVRSHLYCSTASVTVSFYLTYLCWVIRGWIGVHKRAPLGIIGTDLLKTGVPFLLPSQYEYQNTERNSEHGKSPIRLPTMSSHQLTTEKRTVHPLCWPLNSDWHEKSCHELQSPGNNQWFDPVVDKERLRSNSIPRFVQCFDFLTFSASLTFCMMDDRKGIESVMNSASHHQWFTSRTSSEINWGGVVNAGSHEQRPVNGWSELLSATYYAAKWSVKFRLTQI